MFDVDREEDRNWVDYGKKIQSEKISEIGAVNRGTVTYNPGRVDGLKLLIPIKGNIVCTDNVRIEDVDRDIYILNF